MDREKWKVNNLLEKVIKNIRKVRLQNKESRMKGRESQRERERHRERLRKNR